MHVLTVPKNFVNCTECALKQELLLDLCKELNSLYVYDAEVDIFGLCTGRSRKNQFKDGRKRIK